MGNKNILPNDVMDFLCKVGAWFEDIHDTEKQKEIKQRLIKINDRLLEKYDCEIIDAVHSVNKASKS